jgi:hypothetical protein
MSRARSQRSAVPSTCTSTSAYACFGFTAIARFAGSVQGVVVQMTAYVGVSIAGRPASVCAFSASAPTSGNFT